MTFLGHGLSTLASCAGPLCTQSWWLLVAILRLIRNTLGVEAMRHGALGIDWHSFLASKHLSTRLLPTRYLVGKVKKGAPVVQATSHICFWQIQLCISPTGRDMASVFHFHLHTKHATLSLSNGNICARTRLVLGNQRDYALDP